MNYSETIQFLYGLQIFGANFGLENTLRLAAHVGNPQNGLRFIHIAGTNGKGSTCAMLESIYRAAGLRVGLFTSPHLVSFRERIQVNRQLISEDDIVRLVTEIRAANQEHETTLFEFVTVMALKYFAEQKCDLVIWETGLGGRLDATNIVMPLASVITNIALDHTQWLGDTLEKIAAEKAGIIKPGIPVVTATEAPGALAVIEKSAGEKNAPLLKVAPASHLRAAGVAALPLPGEHQRQNAALALAAVDVLQKEIPVSAEQIRAGLNAVSWPGRLQLIARPNGRKILLDGAHNPAGAATLCAALPSMNFSAPVLIVGFLSDKDWRPMCALLAPLAAKIFTVPVASARTAQAGQLAEACRAAQPAAEVVTCDSLSSALQQTSAENFVIITGSLYLIGEALELLGLSPAGDGERALNEWQAGPPLAV